MKVVVGNPNKSGKKGPSREIGGGQVVVLGLWQTLPPTPPGWYNTKVPHLEDQPASNLGGGSGSDWLSGRRDKGEDIH